MGMGTRRTTGNPGLGDDDVFTLEGLLDELREVRLRFVDVGDFHAGSPY